MHHNPPPLAIVTGASSGIGLAIAERLLRDGWRVRGISRRAPPIAHAAFEHVAADLADAQEADRVAASIGTPHALIHAAGVLHAAPLQALGTAHGERMWRLHVDAATRLASAVLPRMADAGVGRMVLIGSRVSAGMPGRSQYAATKAALVALARSWAAEVVARGVTVNVVAPAATETAMLDDPSRAASQPKLPPLGRLIRPDEVAALVAYLLGHEAAAITGQEIVICGGASLAR